MVIRPLNIKYLEVIPITKGFWRTPAYLHTPNLTSSQPKKLNTPPLQLGINNPRQIGAIWATSLPTPFNSTSGVGTPDYANPFYNSQSLYGILFNEAKYYIITISASSIIGSLLLIKYIDYVPRKALLMSTFMILAVLFALVAGTLKVVGFKGNKHVVTVVLYILLQFVFNLGMWNSCPLISC